MEWRLGLPAWIVQDGNYTDVRRGDRVEAAVEIAFFFAGIEITG